jgi:hypothetical protein
MEPQTLQAAPNRSGPVQSWLLIFLVYCLSSFSLKVLGGLVANNFLKFSVPSYRLTYYGLAAFCMFIVGGRDSNAIRRGVGAVMVALPSYVLIDMVIEGFHGLWIDYVFLLATAFIEALLTPALIHFAVEQFPTEASLFNPVQGLVALAVGDAVLIPVLQGLRFEDMSGAVLIGIATVLNLVALALCFYFGVALRNISKAGMAGACAHGAILLLGAVGFALGPGKNTFHLILGRIYLGDSLMFSLAALALTLICVFLVYRRESTGMFVASIPLICAVNGAVLVASWIGRRHPWEPSMSLVAAAGAAFGMNGFLPLGVFAAAHANPGRVSAQLLGICNLVILVFEYRRYISNPVSFFLLQLVGTLCIIGFDIGSLRIWLKAAQSPPPGAPDPLLGSPEATTTASTATPQALQFAQVAQLPVASAPPPEAFKPGQAPASAPSQSSQPGMMLPEPVSQSEAPDSETCVVCLAARKTHAFLPCGHTCMCQSCAELLMKRQETCPVCRQTPERAMHIFA